MSSDNDMEWSAVSQPTSNNIIIQQEGTVRTNNNNNNNNIAVSTNMTDSSTLSSSASSTTFDSNMNDNNNNSLLSQQSSAGSSSTNSLQPMTTSNQTTMITTLARCSTYSSNNKENNGVVNNKKTKKRRRPSIRQFIPNDIIVELFGGDEGKSLYKSILLNYQFSLSMMSSNFLGSPLDVSREFQLFGNTRALFMEHFRKSGRLSSAYNGDVTRNLLEEMTSIDWKRFFKSIEDAGNKIEHCWAIEYLWDGKHPWHRDKRFQGTHRWIVSLGCLGKEFWLQCGDCQVKHMLRHGSIVCMDKKTSGLTDGSFRHAGLGDASGSYAVVFETTFVG